MAYAPAGGRLFAGSADGFIKLWDLWRARQETALSGHQGEVRSLDVSAEGEVLSLGADNRMIRWAPGSGRNGSPVVDELFAAGSVDLSNDGRYALVGGMQREDAPFRVIAAALSPDCRFAAGGGSDGMLRLWDVRDSRELYSTVAHGEAVLAVVWSPDGRHLASASHDSTVKLWDIATGEELRTFRGHRSTVRSVAFSPDGRYIASGSWDTTVKLWEAGSGRELAMLVGFDDGEWVIVTPEGYYASSGQGARRLNVLFRGEVYGIDSYVEKFYRPDIVESVLSGMKLANLDTLGDVDSPPSVSIEEVEKLTEELVRVHLQVTDTGGGIGDVRILLNDSVVALDNIPEEASRGRELALSYLVGTVKGSNRISAVAFNHDNTMSGNRADREFLSRLRRERPVSLHALVIGINEYKNPGLQLAYAVPDAKLIAETIRKAAAPLFDRVDMQVLTTREQTTTRAIREALASYRHLEPQDLFLFYVASHGLVERGEFFLITSDVGSLSPSKLRENAVNQETIKTLIANIPTFKKLIIIDTCNSQALGESLQAALLTRGLTEDTAFKVLSRAIGITILSAARTAQEALEGYRGHGLFTYVVAEGLRGAADHDRDGYIKTFELADYVDNEVPRLAEQVFKRVQYPTVSPAGQGFPIGKVGE